MHLGIVVKCLIGVLVLHSVTGFSEQGCSSRKREIVALILARGGSKGIPFKNLAKLQGESLLLRALRVTKNSQVFREIWVSTDSDLIASEAETLDGISVHRRPETSALDTTSSLESVQEFLSHHKEIEYIALIQCTSVFLRESYLKVAADLFNHSECVFTVTRYNNRFKNLISQWKNQGEIVWSEAVYISMEVHVSFKKWSGSVKKISKEELKLWKVLPEP